MRRFIFTLGVILVSCYLVLHLVLGSSPVQRKVVQEISRVLAAYGFDLKIESIEFSAFTPKAYLNRVTITSTAKAEISLPNPVKIDKIKIEFQPLALIYKRIVIEEATFFHPTLILPRADKLYKTISNLIRDKKNAELKGGAFTVVINKFGFVDALLDIGSQDPPFKVRSPSVTTFLENSSSHQQTVTLQSKNLNLERGPLKLAFTNIDLDVDLSLDSLRLNRALVETETMSINLKGSSSFPKKGKLPDSLFASYEINLPLPLLNDIPELKAPKLTGAIGLVGSLQLSDGVPSGRGQFSIKEGAVEDYKLGTGEVTFAVGDKKLTLTALHASYGGGIVKSNDVAIELRDRFAISGRLDIKNVKLQGILDGVHCADVPVRMNIDGGIAVSGFLAGPFDLKADVKGVGDGFVALQDNKKPEDADNTVISIGHGDLEGQLAFSLEKMGFQAAIQTLGGKLLGDGYVSFNHEAKVHIKGEGLSLTQLKNISVLRVAGNAKLEADIDVVGSDPKIKGNFEVEDGELSSIVLGDVDGDIFFQNDLLSFENLESETNLEPIHANGFVDFNPKLTHYKFHAETRRVEMNEVFDFFKKQKLPFSAPKGGEVAGRISIEGGHDSEGLEIIASGVAKSFRWYNEQWLTSNFFVTYRPDQFTLNRLLLFKKTGGVELQGKFSDLATQLNITSHELRLEELDSIGKAPVTGEISGGFRLNGKLTNPTGSGDLKLIRTTYRGNDLPDSAVHMRTEGNEVEILGKFFGERLRGRFARGGFIGEKGSEASSWDLAMRFDGFDFTPIICMLIGKDLPTITGIYATGDFRMTGQLTDWETFNGLGTVSMLNIGLKGTPMKNSQPLRIKIEQGGVRIEGFELVGSDSQLALEFLFKPDKVIQAKLDGKVDLQFLQPFIPGLEYGTGKVTAGLRLSGIPANYQLIGNVTLEDGVFRITGLNDEFRSAQVQMSVSQDRVGIDRFSATVNGGTVSVGGDVHTARFSELVPNLSITANRVLMRTNAALATRFSGEFFIRGKSAPYLLGGNCRILEANLSSFDIKKQSRVDSPLLLNFDISCEAKDKLIVNTDVMNAEFHGGLHLLGNNQKVGLLGSLETIQGYMLFRERKFGLTSGVVKFESSESIEPRFNISGRAAVKEQKTQGAQLYEVDLNVYGKPDNYQIRLTASPTLVESDIISLLLLGVTSSSQSNDFNFLDLGGTLSGQIPVQSKIQSELGLDIKMSNEPSQVLPNTAVVNSVATTEMVPIVRIQKEITKSTKLSYSNTFEAFPVRELKIEHRLDDNFTLNGTAVDKHLSTTDTNSVQSYGLDFRYRFKFE